MTSPANFTISMILNKILNRYKDNIYNMMKNAYNKNSKFISHVGSLKRYMS